MDQYLSWFKMSIGQQISNIGSEVNRAIRYKDKDYKRCAQYANKAIELIERTQMDPKNRHRIGELGNCKEELIDYFFGDNIYGTTPQVLQKYYDAFL